MRALGSALFAGPSGSGPTLDAVLDALHRDETTWHYALLRDETARWTRRRKLARANDPVAWRAFHDPQFRSALLERRVQGRVEGIVSLSFREATVAGDARRVGRLECTVGSAPDATLAGIADLVRHLWLAGGWTYGFSVLDDDLHAVEEELTGVPLMAWPDPGTRADAARLFRLQRAMRHLGDFVRGATWGTFLSPGLLARLGGIDRLRGAVPRGAVERLGDPPGAYIQLGDFSVTAGEVARAAAALDELLAPLLAPELR